MFSHICELNMLFTCIAHGNIGDSSQLPQHALPAMALVLASAYSHLRIVYAEQESKTPITER